jgi:hypothetical protein
MLQLSLDYLPMMNQIFLSCPFAKHFSCLKRMQNPLFHVDTLAKFSMIRQTIVNFHSCSVLN